MPDYDAIIEDVREAKDYTSVFNALYDDNLDYLMDDFLSPVDMAERMAKDFSTNGMEALRDYKDLDPYGDVYQESGCGYPIDSDMDTLRDHVIGELEELRDQELSNERE